MVRFQKLGNRQGSVNFGGKDVARAVDRLRNIRTVGMSLTPTRPVSTAPALDGPFCSVCCECRKAELSLLLSEVRTETLSLVAGHGQMPSYRYCLWFRRPHWASPSILGTYPLPRGQGRPQGERSPCGWLLSGQMSTRAVLTRLGVSASKTLVLGQA